MDRIRFKGKGITKDFFELFVANLFTFMVMSVAYFHTLL